MADFVQKTQTKTVVRELASPVADVMASNPIVQTVITDNRLYSRDQTRNTTYSGMWGNILLFPADRQDWVVGRLKKKIERLEQRLTIVEEQEREPSQ